jgi:hypothetical protein
VCQFAITARLPTGIRTGAEYVMPKPERRRCCARGRTFPRPGQPVYATFDHVIVCGAETLAVVDNPRERHIQGYLSEAFALRVIIANWKRGAVNNVATMGCLICITLHPMIEILI